MSNLSEETWGRFHNLAPRIRSLSHTTGTLSSESISVLHLTNPKPLPLLPNLREMRWIPSELIASFMTLGLQKLHSQMYRDVDFDNFTQTASALGSRLREIRTDGLRYPTRPQDEELFINALRLLSGLRTADINLGNMDLGPFVLALSELPDVTQVKLSRSSISIPAIPMSVNGLFPSIKCLKLYAQVSTSGVAALLNCITDNSDLTTFLLATGTGGFGPGGLGEVIKSLGRHRDLHSVMLLANYEPICITARLMAPICHCNSLEFLRVNVKGKFAMTDGELESMLQNLPKLLMLDLIGYLYALPTLSIKSLGIVTTSCPLIREVRFSTLDTSPQHTQNSFQLSHTLQSIYVGGSSIKNAHGVALFLHRLSDAPDLDITSSAREVTEKRLWSEVSTLVRKMNGERAQERENIKHRTELNMF